MQKPIALIFDFDGTIVDSIDIVSKIQDAILEKFDIPRTKELDKKIDALVDEILQGENRKKIGMSILIAIFKLLGLNFFQRIKALILARKTWKILSPKISLFEGTEELFQFFDEGGYLYSIVTTSSTLEVADRLEIKYPEFYEKIKEKIIARDNVEKLKPHPESAQKAADIMGVSLDRCIVVGDMKSDIELGKAVNAVTIGVLTGFLNTEQFKNLGADFILDTIIDIPKIIDQIKKKVDG